MFERFSIDDDVSSPSSAFVSDVNEERSGVDRAWLSFFDGGRGLNDERSDLARFGLITDFDSAGGDGCGEILLRSGGAGACGEEEEEEGAGMTSSLERTERRSETVEARNDVENAIWDSYV